MADMRRRAAVTGAASGIGRAVALRLLQEGLEVVAVDINGRGLDPVATAGAATLVADLASSPDRDKIVERCVGVDHFVNAAGIVRLKPILESTVEDLREVFSVNVEATWDLVSRIGRTMPPGSSIVNLSSASAKLATTTEGAAYAASKAAVLSITRSFAYAFAPRNVRVNALCPGLIDTPMQEEVVAGLAAIRGVPASQMSIARSDAVPLGRFGTADECAAAIWFLLSDQSAYMTGQAIDLSGGMVMW